MVAKVKTEKELADAVTRGEDTIEIEADFAEHVYKIKATGSVVWVVAIGAIGVAAFAVATTTVYGRKTAFVSALSAGSAVAILGVGATSSALALAVAARGVGVLTKLRKYRVVSYTNNRLVLQQ